MDEIRYTVWFNEKDLRSVNIVVTVSPDSGQEAYKKAASLLQEIKESVLLVAQSSSYNVVPDYSTKHKD